MNYQQTFTQAYIDLGSIIPVSQVYVRLLGSALNNG